MTKEEFIARLKTLNTHEDCVAFQQEICADENIWFFQKEFGNKAGDKYKEFKTYMANKFGITPQEVTICGSAKFGFSMNPKNNFSDFDEGSDIDIVIISKKLYDKFWQYLLEAFVKNESGLENLYRQTASNIFRGFINTDGLSQVLGHEYLEWEQKTQGYQKDLQIDFKFPADIGYRIYRSYQDYNLYIVKNIKDLIRGLEV